ncbi:clathrin coat assembly protein AP180-like [Impatiens glandulifera]|uniref:clathrin coat assembly protein AP180-like n=1 Tax=Impatiens glandulifera TaxID=253017 RepID=UPI001FB0F28F|nr:clathrin coat assembly protein AP180-like [Impatiens glandulifera]
MQSKLKKAIGAVKDQTSIRLAKVSSNTTSSLEVAVLKATTHDHEDPMDEHYVEEILTLVSSDKSHAAACARAIGKRIGRTRNWVVAIKSLLLILRIFQDGDPYFPREVIHCMKRGEKILNLSSFRDNSSSSSPWDYTAFVRTFALYLDERLDCFLTGKLQRRRTQSSIHTDHSRPRRSQSVRVNEPVVEMKPAMLLDKISYWQGLMDRAVSTRPTGAAKTNKLIHVTLHAVVHESFDLYKDISDGLALLLDSFFHLPYNSCVSAFQACVKATKQFDELIVFYEICKNIGVGRPSEYPPVQKISEELLETLKEFLKDKSSFPTTRVSPTKQRPSSAAVSRRRHNSCLSELSEETATTTNTSPDQQSRITSRCTSLEDLFSAMDTSGKGKRSISIDLEAYSITDIHEFEKQCQRDSTCSGNDDACSAKSLPITSSIDLFDDWPGKDDENTELETKTKQCNNGLDDLITPKASHPEGWEMVLTETVTPSPKLGPVQGQHYNPFLHEPSFEAAGEISVPTFQAVPTFWAANPSNETDPFATFPPVGSSDQGLDWAQNSPKLLQEQQLWLQQQDKIIAKRIS